MRKYILILSIIMIIIYSYYDKKYPVDIYEFEITYACAWHRCKVVYSNSIEETGNCLITDKMKICGEYYIKYLKEKK